MLHRLHPIRAALVAAAMVSCGGESLDDDMTGVKQALESQYPGARFEVGFIGGLRHLELTVDTAVYGNYRLDDAERRALAEEMARVAIEQLGVAAALDSITIDFVQERSGGLLSKSWSAIRETLAVADLREGG